MLPVSVDPRAMTKVTGRQSPLSSFSVDPPKLNWRGSREVLWVRGRAVEVVAKRMESRRMMSMMNEREASRPARAGRE
jgi:hypothetical protein